MRRHGKGPQPRERVSYPEALVRGLHIQASSFLGHSCFVIVQCRDHEYEQEQE
jgi:hypothetical protein